MVEKRNIPISLPAIGDEEWQALREPVLSGWVTQGPKVTEFEKQFSVYHQTKYAIAVTSCTTGLHLALSALGVGEGDEVIVPAFTWVATANAVLYCGARPVFVDIDPITFNIDPDQIAKKVTSRTKAIIPVHLFGLCADMDAIKDAIPGDVKILEDAACAAGASYKGRMAGALGDAAAFSFHPRKTITTGEGGMITTNDEQLSETMNIQRNHGASISEEQRHQGPRPYLLPDFDMLGYNYRMTDLQGAMGLVQLGKLEVLLAERRKWADFYINELASIDWLQLPSVDQDYQHGWQSFVCTVKEDLVPQGRNAIMEYLQQSGVSTRPGTHAVHMLNYFKKRFSLSAGDFPVACTANDTSMAIPLHNMMQEEDYQYVVQCLKNV